MNQAGVTEQGDIDCIVAIVASLMGRSSSNDPAGNRWIRHLNRLIDLFVDDDEGAVTHDCKSHFPSEARVLAEAEFARFAELVASLTPVEWATPTDCIGSDVRKTWRMSSVQATRRPPSGVRPSVAAGHSAQQGDRLHHWVDGLNELQIRSVDNLERRTRGTDCCGRSKGGQGPLAHPASGPLYPFRSGRRSDGHPSSTCSTWGSPAMSGLIGSMSTRPLAGRCSSGPITMAASWPTSWPNGADLHRQPFELVLDGPAGGKFVQGVGGERVEIDALDFIRTLSGRLPGEGVLRNPLPL